MKNYSYLVLVVFLILSCKEKHRGNIVTRYSKLSKDTIGSYFLINTSHSQTFRYTVKKYISFDDSVYDDRETTVHKLSPGEELFLGDRFEIEGATVTEETTTEEVNSFNDPIEELNRLTAETGDPIESYNRQLGDSIEVEISNDVNPVKIFYKYEIVGATK